MALSGEDTLIHLEGENNETITQVLQTLSDRVNNFPHYFSEALRFFFKPAGAHLTQQMTVLRHGLRQLARLRFEYETSGHEKE